MIGYLKGNLKLMRNNQSIVEVSGVGYSVLTGPLGVLEGQEVELYIHTHVREQEITLYGFKTLMDLEVFELLLTVSGVGPKSALIMILERGSSEIVKAISTSNVLGVKTKGIGSKTAEKVIIELKNKVEQFRFGDTSETQTSFNNNMYLDIVEALSGLGYKKPEIDNAYKNIEIASEDSTQAVMKKLLNYLRK